MKTYEALKAVATPLALSVVFAWITGGCSTPSGGSAPPKPGSGIAEYREITRDAHQAVANMVDRLEDISVSFPASSRPLERFDRTLLQLEVTSVKSRSRAEAIIARGQAYFDEWKEHLAASTNDPVGGADAERYTRLHAHFDRIREHSAGVRTEFRPFMMGLRELRATFDTAPNSSGSEPARQRIAALTASGRRMLDVLTEVSKSLDAADVEFRASLAAKGGGPSE